MKTNLPQLTLSLLLATWLWSGCSKNGSSSLTPEKVPMVMNEAFKDSSGEAKEAASTCVSACESQDVTVAFAALQKLNQSKELTPQQRVATSKAMAVTLQQLRASAEQGNPTARAAFHQYNSTR